jgi:hypothetical protein
MRDLWNGLATWAKWSIGIVGVLIVIGLVSGSDDGGDSASGDNASAPASYKETVLSSIDGEDAWVRCEARTCTAQYRVEILGLFNTRDELMEEMRDTWKALFTGRRARVAQIRLTGETESVGGRMSTSPILRVTCDRGADRQINWDAVDNEGLEVLCDWDELVELD